MRVVAATLQLASRSETRVERTESTQVRFRQTRSTPQVAAAGGQAASVQLSAGARERAAGIRQSRPAPSIGTAAELTRRRCRAEIAAAEGGDLAYQGESVQLYTLRILLAKLTGRCITVARPGDFAASEATHPGLSEREASPPPQATGNAPKGAGFSLELSHELRTERQQSLDFAAAGVVQTADGREIEIVARYRAERRELTVERTEIRAGDAQLKDPLVLTFDGMLADLEQSVELDLDGDGRAENVPFAGGAAAFLVHDRNGNGRVDDGSELFGARSGDGFAELQALDRDRSGFVDEGDAAFAQLYLWQGRTDQGDELVPLAARGVGALCTGATSTPFEIVDGAGGLRGALRSTGVFLQEDGQVGLLEQLDLVV